MKGALRTGICPRCFSDQPLIWDGTIRPHGSLDHFACPGALHAPFEPHHVHRCTCGAAWDEHVEEEAK